MADMQLNVPLDPGMNFKIGSTTKQFTAVAIMLLVERGKISLDDTISHYIKDSPDTWRSITIEHLLTHTSGIDDIIDYDHIRDDFTVDELIQTYRNKDILFTPGEDWKYSNPGYVLLGKIIETVSGESYEQFLMTNIFEPSGMQSTTLGNNSRITKGLISGYRKTDNHYINARYMSMSHPYAAGGLVTNVNDLRKWYIALNNGKIIRRETLKKCYSPYRLNNGQFTEYGYGWFINKFKGLYNISHGGGVFGFVNHTMYLPQKGIYIALLSNRIDPNAVPGTQGIAERVAALVIGEAVVVKKQKAIVLSESELRKYTGTYRLDENSHQGRVNFRLIMLEENRIFFGLNEQRRVEIFPKSINTFFIKNVPGMIRFEFNEQGNVIRFIQERSDGSELIGYKTEE